MNGEVPRERIIDESCDYTPDAIDALRYALTGRSSKQVFIASPRKGGKLLLNKFLERYMEKQMTEKFKTKYHALAWAAEDTTNIFVDNAGMSYRISHGVILRQCASDGLWNNVTSNLINEPCRKAEPKKKTQMVVDMSIEELLEIFDARYLRKAI